MTPLLRQIYVALQSIPSPASREYALKRCREALCFEVTDVYPLAMETIKTLCQTTEYNIDGPVIPHGGLMVMPHHTVWLEWRLPREGDLRTYRAGCFLMEATSEDDGHHAIVVETTTSELIENRCHKSYVGRILVLPDDRCSVAGINGSLDDEPDDEEIQRTGGISAIYALAMLLILNAPYGIRQDAQPLHKAHARHARTQGFTLKPHRVVYLDKTRPPPTRSTDNPDGPAFHKAFHFVRQHLRHYQPTSKREAIHTLVKAHWRGDPRLGICPIHDYKVRP